jgi:hypothetical protein
MRLVLVIAGASWMLVAGCARSPLPSLGVPTSCGNACANLNCPSAYRCDVDSNCTPHCEPEKLGDRPF